MNMKTNDYLMNPYGRFEKYSEYEFEYEDMLYDISTMIFKNRLSRNMNQSEFAELLDISQSMVSKLESGEYNPSIGQLLKVTRKLNVKMDIKFKVNNQRNKIINDWSEKKEDSNDTIRKSFENKVVEMSLAS